MILLIIRTYQVCLGPFFGGQCRFEPSCSHYALQAFQQVGFFRAFVLTCRRLCRCHPLSGAFGYDPVPRKENGNV